MTMFLEELKGERGLWWILALSFLVGASLWKILGRTVTRCRCRKPLKKGHLSRARRWNGGLRYRFEFRMKMRGLIFLCLWTSGQAMDVEQVQRMFNHLLQLTESTMTAARSSAMVARNLIEKTSRAASARPAEF